MMNFINKNTWREGSGAETECDSFLLGLDFRTQKQLLKLDDAKFKAKVKGFDDRKERSDRPEGFVSATNLSIWLRGRITTFFSGPSPSWFLFLPSLSEHHTTDFRTLTVLENAFFLPYLLLR